MLLWQRKTAFLTVLLLCLWFLLWKKTSKFNINYDDRNRVFSQEYHEKYLPVKKTDSSLDSGSQEKYEITPHHWEKNSSIDETAKSADNNIRSENNPSIDGTEKSADNNSGNVAADFDAFEPDVNEDIQTVDSKIPRIPRIIHLIFISQLQSKHGIPSIYKNNVLSFLHFNPNWTYYFWSNIPARDLIATRHPSLLRIYDNYQRPIRKASVLRYVLMYEFGGVYADLDMKCLRPLDRTTMKYACILTPEPFEHSAIGHKMPYLLSNAFMMCRPQHPFFKQVIEAIPKAAEAKYFSEETVGQFLTSHFLLYNKIKSDEANRTKTSRKSNSPYFYHSSLAEETINATYVSNTQYFMSSFDQGKTPQFQDVCARGSAQYAVVKRGCTLWMKRKNITISNPFSYTDHMWSHLYSITETTQMVPIQSVIPQIKQYNSTLKPSL